MGELNEQFLDSINRIFDITSRVDERVKFLIEQHASTNERINKMVEKQELLSQRVSLLESNNNKKLAEDISELKIKMSNLEIYKDLNNNKWKLVADIIFKISIPILIGLFLYYMGIPQ